MRTIDGAGSPATVKSLIRTSSGDGAWLADVIMAITLCPARWLKAGPSEITKAGRFLSAWRGEGKRHTHHIEALKAWHRPFRLHRNAIRSACLVPPPGTPHRQD